VLSSVNVLRSGPRQHLDSPLQRESSALLRCSSGRAQAKGIGRSGRPRSSLIDRMPQEFRVSYTSVLSPATAVAQGLTGRATGRVCR
jgi:hypothetical protein